VVKPFSRSTRPGIFDGTFVKRPLSDARRIEKHFETKGSSLQVWYDHQDPRLSEAACVRFVDMVRLQNSPFFLPIQKRLGLSPFITCGETHASLVGLLSGKVRGLCSSVIDILSFRFVRSLFDNIVVFQLASTLLMLACSLLHAIRPFVSVE
jgi:hypothetical protein